MMKTGGDDYDYDVVVDVQQHFLKHSLETFEFFFFSFFLYLFLLY